MIMKRGLLVLVVLSILLVNFAGAQIGDGSGSDALLEEEVEVIQDTVESAEDLKYRYLEEGWEDFFKDNALHKFLGKMNRLFIVLFARPYALSLELFFAICLWFATLLSFTNYLFFFKEGWQKFFGSLGATIIIAHLKIFNFVSAGLFKIMFHKPSIWWQLIIFIVIIVSIVGYWTVNDKLGKYLEAAQKAKKLASLEKDVGRQKGAWGQIVKKTGEVSGENLS